jgi:hypothetical protein
MAKHPATITEKNSGFGQSSHPIHPDGRILQGPKSSLPAERLTRGHLFEKLSKP